MSLWDSSESDPNSNLICLVGTHLENEEPRRKRTGYQDEFYLDAPQEAGNLPLTTITLRLV